MVPASSGSAHFLRLPLASFSFLSLLFALSSCRTDPVTPSDAPPAPARARGLDVNDATCVTCHLEADADPDLGLPPAVKPWRGSPHGKSGVGCFHCHGGDPTLDDGEEAMSGRRGFIGVPPAAFFPGLCGRCHAGALTEVRAGTHPGMRENPEAGPNCTECHGYHEIRRR